MREAGTAIHPILDKKNRHLLNVRVCLELRQLSPAPIQIGAGAAACLLDFVAAGDCQLLPG
jgi:hypothetical protein